MEISPCLVELPAGMNGIEKGRRNHNCVREWDIVTHEVKEECLHPSVADKWEQELRWFKTGSTNINLPLLAFCSNIGHQRWAKQNILHSSDLRMIL